MQGVSGAPITLVARESEIYTQTLALMYMYIYIYLFGYLQTRKSSRGKRGSSAAVQQQPGIQTAAPTLEAADDKPVQVHSQFRPYTLIHENYVT